jgi:hypothetical protein
VVSDRPSVLVAAREARSQRRRRIRESPWRRPTGTGNLIADGDVMVHTSRFAAMVHAATTECPFEGTGGLTHSLPSCVHRTAHRKEWMDHARIISKFDCIPVPLEALSIGSAVIAKRVAFSNDDQRRGQARKVFTDKGRIAEVVAIGVA